VNAGFWFLSATNTKNLLIPDDLLGDQRQDGDILILPYLSGKESLKTKLTLQSNLFTLLLEGEKSVSKI